MKKFAFIVFFLSLLLVLPSGKPAAVRNISISIKPVFGKKDLVLEKERYVTTEGDTVAINRLRFYLSGFRLILDNGSVYSEPDSYHLIDAEEPQSQNLVLKNVPEGKISKLIFNIGIDSVASVSGALDGDLDPARGMYWAWNSGYINAKLEGKSSQCPSTHNEFEFHVGGYLSPFRAIREVSITLFEKESKHIKLVSDVEAWFKQVQLGKLNSIVMPGAEAMAMADRYVNMFKIAEP